jgi:glucose/arabinose dehydrogenase
VTISLALLAGLIPVFVYGERAVADGTLPDGFTQTRFIGGLASPTAMEFAPEGRLFVAEQGGTLRIVKDGQLMTFLDISKKVDASGECGLLGVAFDPDSLTTARTSTSTTPRKRHAGPRLTTASSASRSTETKLTQRARCYFSASTS